MISDSRALRAKGKAPPLPGSRRCAGPIRGCGEDAGPGQGPALETESRSDLGNPTGPRFDLGVQPETTVRNNSQQFAAIHSYSQIIVTKDVIIFVSIRNYSQLLATKVNGNSRSCSQIFANIRDYSYLCSNILATIRSYSQILADVENMPTMPMPMPAIAESRNPGIAKSWNRGIVQSWNREIAESQNCKIAESRNRGKKSRFRGLESEMGIGNMPRQLESESLIWDWKSPSVSETGIGNQNIENIHTIARSVRAESDAVRLG